MALSTSLIAAIAAAGCVTVKVARSAAPAEPAPRSIAVMYFETQQAGTIKANVGNSTVDGCVESVIALGLRPVEGQFVATAVQERIIRYGNTTGEPDYYRRLGQLTGADAFVLGSVSLTQRSGRIAKASFRLVSSMSGNVLSTATLSSLDGSDPSDAGNRGCRALLTGRSE